MCIKNKVSISLILLLVITLVSSFLSFSALKEKQKMSVISFADRQLMLIEKNNSELKSELMPRALRHTVLKTAKIATMQIVEDRKHYTKRVVGKLLAEVPDVKPVKDYEGFEGGIPLPATYVREVSEQINKSGIYNYDLLSKWNINKGKALNTDFEKEAFEYLYEKRGESFSRFLVHNDSYSLRYATPDVAVAQACVSCHNGHSGSPKNSFVLGEMMGMLVVTIPIGHFQPGIESFFDASDNGQVGTNTFRKTQNAFDMTILALLNGGEAPKDLGMAEFAVLPAATNPDIREKLVRVKKLWDASKKSQETVFLSEPNSTEYIIAYNDLLKNSSSALQIMDEVVADYQEISKKKDATAFWVQTVGLGATLLALVFTWLVFSSQILKPLSYLVVIIKQIASGDFTQSIKIRSNDEIGKLSESVNNMIKELQKMVLDMKNNSITVGTVSQKLADVSKKMVSSSDNMNKESGKLSNAAALISESANTMASSTEEMSVNVSTVSSASEEMSQNTNMVASAMEEISTSINGVEKNATETLAVANRAMEMSSGASSTMDMLGEAADEIGKVTDVIKRIAEQTNLLALNATIEAASAGDAGKGFAVVANEIKELANQSAQAAEDIANKINGVQTNSKSAVEVIRKVVDVIEKINVSVTGITTAVSEQTRAVNDISSNISDVATGASTTSSSFGEINMGVNGLAENASKTADSVSKIASNIKSIDLMSKGTTGDAQSINNFVSELTNVFGSLKNVVDNFKVESVNLPEGADSKNSV